MKMTLIDREGVRSEIEAESDMTVMEAIRESGFDDTFAICSGCLSCASCHVYVDDATLAKLPPRAEDEEELLSSSDDIRPGSRLSCQLLCDPELDGAIITIAPL